ncbi:LLM class flavin-dependent oxidoreductase [Ktedonosporobacter rubrisoli]|uniref:LLM class flavin-dependent oxidoreductase n=1 Tax=Ktedonosporobacter rubrisoli TaxID=2509675 RepID=A0A4P6K007_KTERU|nr:LLM class flavin-dependent oxidoreductase [Ktedonosporobacter rubrisoli]QBD81113.1 LLM class flavin-dependent oxidoreductase [Ktedonosporobacter rubrisoli]
MEKQAEVRSLRTRVGISVQPADPATLVANLVEIEEAGVDHAWVAFGPLGYPDVLTTLAAAAARTSRLKLGTSIIQITSRHPVLMAQQVMSLTRLAPGRLKLGIGGTGLAQMAKSFYGVDMDAPLAYLREYIQVLRPLLAQGEVHHRGHYFTVDASISGTAQVPLFVSALGAGAFRFAGEVADGALPFIAPIPYLLNTALPALSAGAAAAGRPRPPVVAHVSVALTEDRASALQAGRQALSIYPTLPAYRNMLISAGFTEQDTNQVSDRLIEGLLVFGDEDRIRERVLEMLATEIDALALSLVPVSGAAQEHIRLARLVGRL